VKLVVHRARYFMRLAMQISHMPAAFSTGFLLSLSLATLLSSCTKTSEIGSHPETAKAKITAQPAAAIATEVDPNVSTGKNETIAPATPISELKLGETKKYTYKTGLFQIDIPKTWTVRDVSTSKQVGVIWINPNRTILLGVQINVNSLANGIPSKPELAEILPVLVKSTFGARPNFEMSPVAIEPDKAPRVLWSYTGDEGNIKGFSDIQQDGDKLTVLTAGILEKNASKQAIAAMTKIFNTYKVDSVIQIGEP
jgi:hypothetical protein